MEFDKAEPIQPQPALPVAAPATPAAPVACAACKQPLVGQYWDAGGQSLCQNCSQGVQQAWDARQGSLLSAIGRGAVAAAIGAVIWTAITRVTGYEIGIVAIVVGAIIGNTVKKASAGRGGGAYQAVAVGLTYLACTSHLLPAIYTELMKNDANASGVKMLVVGFASFITSLVGPFLGGFDNIFGILILGFALVQAWRINKRVELKVTGPFELKT